MNLEAHSRNLRLNRLKDESATFFITKCLVPKKPIINREATQVIVSAFAFATEKERIYLRAFVVMPDHWHALFALKEPWTRPKFMHRSHELYRRQDSQATEPPPNIMAGQLL
jgi:REP element-mobilizing transposase RayT